MRLGRPATLDDISDDELDAWKDRGFDWIWLLGVWTTGAAGREVSRSSVQWRQELQQALPDLSEADITGSCFAVVAYTVHEDFGGDAALARLRERMASRGLKLLLDFVPNHTALDHPWVGAHPEYYVQGSEDDLARAPQNYARLGIAAEERILAHGRDPYFPGWPDTLQLDYGRPEVRLVMTGELLSVARRCDGIRCDMAMLLLPDVFESTWGLPSAPFWPEAIQAVRREVPDCLFLAEVYWDREWTLLQQGFDFCYDKTLYDRLLAGRAKAVRDHFLADPAYQNGMARFLENHDEPRAASGFALEMHRAAGVLTYFTPGLRFFHEGQLEGARVKVPVHLGRRPREPVNREIQSYYAGLLRCLGDPVFREGEWQLLACVPAWEGNWTWENFIAGWWSSPVGTHRLVVVNYASHQGQCYARIPYLDLPGRLWRLEDVMGQAVFDRESERLLSTGLYLDMPAWGYHVLSLDVLL
jgi:hypothetical protein